MKQAFLFFLSFVFIAALTAQSKGRECVLVNGQLKEVEYDYNATTGAKTISVNGQVKDLDEVYPVSGKGYAATLPFYVNNEVITIKGVKYQKYGLPRVLGINEVVNFATHAGAHLFAEPGVTKPEVVYVMVRRGCEFQPYIAKDPACEVKIKLTTPLKSVKAGKDIVVTAVVTGVKAKKFTYTWSIVEVSDDFDYNDDRIVGPKNGKSIKVSTKGARGMRLSISVIVTPVGKNCEGTTETIDIQVK